jgi:hypothetical protein
MMMMRKKKKITMKNYRPLFRGKKKPEIHQNSKLKKSQKKKERCKIFLSNGERSKSNKCS